MKTTLAIFGVLFALCAKSDYLYWMIDTGSAGQYNYSSAVLKMEGSDSPVMTINSYTAELANYTGNSLNEQISAYQLDAGGFYATLPSDYVGHSFFIELYNGDNWVAKTAGSSSYLSSIYVGGLSTPAAVPTSLGGTYSVPEPTSGMLFLIGGVLLGLRRRRQV